MAITAEMVKQLRDRTGAGMMDCKAALAEAGGDMDKAIDILRTKGILHFPGEERRFAFQAVHMIADGDFISVAAHWNRNRNNFYGSVPLVDQNYGSTPVGSPSFSMTTRTGPSSRYARNGSSRSSSMRAIRALRACSTKARSSVRSSTTRSIKSSSGD